MVFLGFLINTISQTVSVPIEKITKGINMILFILNGKQRGKQHKVKVMQLERLCGFLNFLTKAVVPGMAFTRRMYSYFSTSMKSHHHVRVTRELKSDFTMWLCFLQHSTIFARPFMDFSDKLLASDIKFYTDAAKQKFLGFGGFCNKSWMMKSWEPNFIEDFVPSIEFLEFYAVAAGALAWIHRFANKRVVLFTDNESVKFMIKGNSSGCKRCMILIRVIVLHCMIHNIRVFAKHVTSKKNSVADSLSRLQKRRFARLTHNLGMDAEATNVPSEIWPVSKIWFELAKFCHM